MKTSIFYLSVLSMMFIFSSCKKENSLETTPANEGIRFEFISNMPAAYSIAASANNVSSQETVNNTAWTKTVSTSSRSTATPSASLMVTPPAEWKNTSNKANVTLKIFVNNIEKASKNVDLSWSADASRNEVKLVY